MISSITRLVDEGLQNNVVTTNKMTFYKTNFNMPVKNLFVDVSNWVRYLGPVDHIGGNTAFSLSGFLPGFEICVFSAIWDWQNNEGSTKTINVNLYSKWVDTDFTTVLFYGANGYNLVVDLPDGGWTEYIFCTNIGCAGWEIDENLGTYYVKASATGNYAIAEVSTAISFQNVPSVTQLGADKAGYIWVEGDNLCFVNANEWKHALPGSYVSNTPGATKSGKIWIDTNNDLHWVGVTGNDYKSVWKVKQFASSFSNGPTGEVNAGTSKKGFIWVDNEFGWTHLSYIGNDGYKYLTGAGDDPYA